MTNFLCVHKTYGIATPRSSGLGSTLHLKASAFQTYPIPRTHHEKKGSLKRASGWSVGRERSNTLSRHEFFFSCELCKPTHMPYGDSPFQLYNYIGTSENNSDLQLSNSACWGRLRNTKLDTKDMAQHHAVAIRIAPATGARGTSTRRIRKMERSTIVEL